MNKVFESGILVNDLDFKFVLNGFHDSIVQFSIKLLNSSIINIIAYDEIATFCYRNLEKGDTIFIEGSLNNNMNIVVNEIYKIF